MLTPEEYGKKAYELFTGGYNCAQSVFTAFEDILPFDHDTVVKMSAAFGGGMGRLREVCGCVSGCFLALSILSADADPTDQKAKTLLYTRTQKFGYLFKARHDSYICRDLLGLEGAEHPVPSLRTAKYYAERPCAELAKDAAEQFAWFLKEEGIV